MFGQIARDIRLAVRQWFRQPALYGAALLTLALGIGANTAIFSFVNALLLRPFPFRDAGQLVEIRSVRGGQAGLLSMREVLDIQQEVGVIESVAAHTTAAGGYNFSGAGGGRPEEWRAILTTGNLFDVLGVPLAAGGRWPQHSDRERDFRVILTHDVWRRAFAGQPAAIGTSITLDHAPGYRIHGVAPRGFDYPRGVEVYRSLGGFATYDQRGYRNVVAVARLRRPVTVERLQAELDGLAARLAERHPESNRGLQLHATAFRDLYSGDVRPYLLVLSGAVAFVLLIACANVMNLLLGRALGRARETAVRVALGAGRGALVRQMLAESAVLTGVAAALGLALAYGAVRGLRALIGAQMPAWMTVDLDGRVLAFTAAVAALAGLVAGLAPALQAWRQSPGETLKEGGRGGSGGRAAGHLRDALVVAQLALAVVLLAGTGLLIRGFAALQAQDQGFRSDGIVTFRVALGWKRYIDQPTTARYYEQALERLRAVPGFRQVAFLSNPPLTRQEDPQPNTVQAEGQSVEEALANPYVTRQSVSEGYFALAGVALRRGRLFTAFDGPQAEPATIVSDRLARRLWPNQDAVGKRLRYNPTATQPAAFRTVVGVVSDVRHRALGGEWSYDYYVPYRQQADANQYLLVQTGLPLPQARSLAERALWAIDSEQSLFDFQSYDQRIQDGVWQLRLSRTLLLVFSGVALVLAMVGAYGVMAYLVGQRTREMGIRLALGASPRRVQAMVLRRGLGLGLAGLVLGIAGALGLGRVLASLLRGIAAVDGPSLALSALLLLMALLAASYVPARRASRVDPLVTLRAE